MAVNFLLHVVDRGRAFVLENTFLVPLEKFSA